MYCFSPYSLKDGGGGVVGGGQRTEIHLFLCSVVYRWKGRICFYTPCKSAKQLLS